MAAKPPHGDKVDLLIDLSNVCWDKALGLPGRVRLGRLDVIVAAWERQFLPNPRFHAVADNSLTPNLPAEDRRLFKDLQVQGVISMAPVADIPLLERSAASAAPIVTRDEFRDHRKRFPWIAGARDRFYDWTVGPDRVELIPRDMRAFTSFEVSEAADRADVKGLHLDDERLKEALAHHWMCSNPSCMTHRLPESLRPLPGWKDGFVCTCGSKVDRGSPRAPAIEVKIGGKSGSEVRRVLEAGTPLVIGRGSVDLDVSDVAGESSRTVSARHAEIEFDGESWYVTDLGSTNGTWVAEWDSGSDRHGDFQRLEPRVRVRLSPRARLSLGKAVKIDRSGKLTVRS